eukprot:Gb_03701 [translate_table: standard]
MDGRTKIERAMKRAKGEGVEREGGAGSKYKSGPHLLEWDGMGGKPMAILCHRTHWSDINLVTACPNGRLYLAVKPVHLKSGLWEVGNTYFQERYSLMNAAIAGITQTGHFDEALKLVRLVRPARMKPNVDAHKLFSHDIWPAGCSSKGQGDSKQIRPCIFTGNALIDMYAKCWSTECDYMECIDCKASPALAGFQALKLYAPTFGIRAYKGTPKFFHRLQWESTKAGWIRRNVLIAGHIQNEQAFQIS